MSEEYKEECIIPKENNLGYEYNPSNKLPGYLLNARRVNPIILYKISFEYKNAETNNDEKITIVPTYYNICDPVYLQSNTEEVRKTGDTRTVEYTITHESTLGTLVSTIPYYISDGYTNKLRANLCYPYFCMNDRNTENSGKICPFTPAESALGNWGLYKIAIVKSMQTEYINRYIYDTEKELREIIQKITLDNVKKYVEKIKSKVPSYLLYGLVAAIELFNFCEMHEIELGELDQKLSLESFDNELVKKLILLTNGCYMEVLRRYTQRREYINKLISIFVRVENILDLLIMCMNPTIINYDRNMIKKYRPVMNPCEKYDMSISGDKDNLNVLNELLDIPDIEGNPDDITIIDLYRNQILLTFQSISSQLLTIVTTEEISIAPEITYCTDMNKRLAYCDSVMSKATKTENIRTYVNISLHLYNNIKHTLNTLEGTIISKIPAIVPTIKYADAPLDTLARLFNGKCILTGGYYERFNKYKYKLLTTHI